MKSWRRFLFATCFFAAGIAAHCRIQPQPVAGLSDAVTKSILAAHHFNCNNYHPGYDITNLQGEKET